MEERSAQRAALKKEREDRRRKVEKERLIKLEMEAEERREREEEEKRKRIHENKEKKKQEKLQQLKKVEEQKRFQGLMEKADEWNTLATLKYRGWKPWRKFIQMIHDRTILAEEKRRNNLLKIAFSLWNYKWFTIEKERAQRADNQFENNLKKNFLKRWRKIGELSQIAELKAVRHHKQKLMTKCLSSWVSYYDEEKIRSWRMENVADSHNTR